MNRKQDNLGSLEEVILMAVQGLGKNAYGAKIHQLLDSIDRNLSIGSLYVVLGRLEEKGYVKSHLGESTAERGGRAKKYFEITGAGSKILELTEAGRYKLKNSVPEKGMAWNL